MHGESLCALVNLASMAPERLAEEREKYAQTRTGVVTQLLSLVRHPALAFLLENPSESPLWYLPWVIREIDRSLAVHLHSITRETRILNMQYL